MLSPSAKKGPVGTPQERGDEGVVDLGGLGGFGFADGDVGDSREADRLRDELARTSGLLREEREVPRTTNLGPRGALIRGGWPLVRRGGSRKRGSNTPCDIVSMAPPRRSLDLRCPIPSLDTASREGALPPLSSMLGPPISGPAQRLSGQWKKDSLWPRPPSRPSAARGAAPPCKSSA